MLVGSDVELTLRNEGGSVSDPRFFLNLPTVCKPFSAMKEGRFPTLVEVSPPRAGQGQSSAMKEGRFPTLVSTREPSTFVSDASAMKEGRFPTLVPGLPLHRPGRAGLRNEGGSVSDPRSGNAYIFNSELTFRNEGGSVSDPRS